MRTRRTPYQESEVHELLRRFHSKKLARQDKLENFRQPAILRAIDHNPEPKGRALVDDVTQEDMLDVLDRLHLTVVMFKGFEIYGYYEMALEIMIGFKEPRKGDLVLFPTPLPRHYLEAVDVFKHFLDERLNGELHPKLEPVYQDAILAPYNLDERNIYRGNVERKLPPKPQKKEVALCSLASA